MPYDIQIFNFLYEHANYSKQTLSNLFVASRPVVELMNPFAKIAICYLFRQRSRRYLLMQQKRLRRNKEKHEHEPRMKHFIMVS